LPPKRKGQGKQPALPVVDFTKDGDDLKAFSKYEPSGGFLVNSPMSDVEMRSAQQLKSRTEKHQANWASGSRVNPDSDVMLVGEFLAPDGLHPPCNNLSSALERGGS
tara:strand:+ start:13766 stop:14086 length:321 start_codon:yes stop_codon:yes gene_type:complete